MSRDNNGFSLVEIIVVIAIMGILVTMLISGSGYQAKSAATALASSIKTAIGETRIKTMGKQETAIQIYKGSDGQYYKRFVVKVNGNEKAETEEVIGKHYPMVEFSTDNGATYTDLSTVSDGILIAFDRTNGKEKVTSHSLTDVPASSILCTNIRVSGGGRVCNIKIEPATGKVTLE